jgi:hypothetical protein
MNQSHLIRWNSKNSCLQLKNSQKLFLKLFLRSPNIRKISPKFKTKSRKLKNKNPNRKLTRIIVVRLMIMFFWAQRQNSIQKSVMHLNFGKWQEKIFLKVKNSNNLNKQKKNIFKTIIKSINMASFNFAFWYSVITTKLMNVTKETLTLSFSKTIQTIKCTSLMINPLIEQDS